MPRHARAAHDHVITYLTAYLTGMDTENRHADPQHALPQDFGILTPNLLLPREASEP